MTKEPAVPPKLGASLWKRAATMIKVLAVFVLILLLLIPLGMIRSVLSERLGRRNQAVAEITSSWGREQTIVGPVLIVPYRYTFKTTKDEITDGKTTRREVIETATANAYFLPSKLTVDGVVKPSKLHRGIYEAVVFSGRFQIEGDFAPPDFGALKIAAQDVMWEDASLTFAIPDLRGTRESLEVKWGDSSVPLAPGTRLPGFDSGMTARLRDLRAGESVIPFSMAVTLNGSSAMRFAPVGMQTTIKLSSPWPDPSFRGAFLPADRRVTTNGFEATWQVSYYGRGYAQQWTDRDSKLALNAASPECEVAFLTVVDAYRNVERAIKYGILFITLTFVVFFLFEVMSSLRIHPFQYTLVGAALCLFYLALLSLSEVIVFPLAYLTAAAACTVMISLYCLAVLKSGARTLIVTGLLAAIYGFLYISLQLQDYSLLFGTIGLFVVLAIVMYATRNINWYARDQGETV